MADARALAIWEVHAGPSLTDSAIDPIRICMELDVLRAVYEGEKYAWLAIIKTVESDLREQ